MSNFISRSSGGILQVAAVLGDLKTTRFQAIAGTVTASFFLGIFSPLAAASPKGEEPSLSITAVADRLVGVMDTSAQADADSNFVSVQMTTCRVAIADSAADSVYLYQEQALSEDLSAPYRQRFLQITPGDRQRIDSNTFKPENPEQWIGLCDRAAAERQVPAEALGDRVCTVALRASPLGFVGSTPRSGCPTNVRGAASITNIVVLHEGGMDTWDRGFDAAGNQVWGAEETPYQYRWVD